MITIGYVAKPLNRAERTTPDGRDIKREFSKRLNQLCDETGIPPKGKNRQAKVGKLFDVSQEGARKWLEAEGLPKFETCLAMALHFNVSVEWLLTERGPKRVAEKPRLAFTYEEAAAARKVAEIASNYATE